MGTGGFEPPTFRFFLCRIDRQIWSRMRCRATLHPQLFLSEEKTLLTKSLWISIRYKLYFALLYHYTLLLITRLCFYHFISIINFNVIFIYLIQGLTQQFP